MGEKDKRIKYITKVEFVDFPYMAQLKWIV